MLTIAVICDRIIKNMCHRRQSAVALICRIRCPSELGLLCAIAGAFCLEADYEKYKG
jgi:hypothetical protein